jgi:hypothetical protein
MIYKIFQGGGMKRLLPFIPIILLLFLGNSCIGTNLAVVTALTLTPIPQINPAMTQVINALNSDLSTISPLGSNMDAQYYVVSILLLNSPSESEQTARMNVDCICMNDTDCCTPERTFVVIVESMRRTYYANIPNTNLPNSNNYTLAFSKVREFTVVCINHRTKINIDAMSVAWQDVLSYLSNPSTAPQLGGNVHHTTLP